MQNGIASHLHFLTDVQGNMYTYVSHLRYHANFLRNSKQNYTIQAYKPVNVWPRTISRN